MTSSFKRKNKDNAGVGELTVSSCNHPLWDSLHSLTIVYSLSHSTGLSVGPKYGSLFGLYVGGG